MMQHWIYLHAAVCLALAFAMFCRLRLTTIDTVRPVRWALAAVFTLSIAAAIAWFAWPHHWPQVQTLLIFAMVFMQWAMSRQWSGNAAPKGLQ